MRLGCRVKVEETIAKAASAAQRLIPSGQVWSLDSALTMLARSCQQSARDDLAIQERARDDLAILATSSRADENHVCVCARARAHMRARACGCTCQRPYLGREVRAVAGDEFARRADDEVPVALLEGRQPVQQQRPALRIPTLAPAFLALAWTPHCQGGRRGGGGFQGGVG